MTKIKKMTKKEIYLAAQAVVKSHGNGAALHAAQGADELMVEGDMEGRRVWHRIGEAITDLVSMKRSPDNTEH